MNETLFYTIRAILAP